MMIGAGPVCRGGGCVLAGDDIVGAARVGAFANARALRTTCTGFFNGTLAGIGGGTAGNSDGKSSVSLGVCRFASVRCVVIWGGLRCGFPPGRAPGCQAL